MKGGSTMTVDVLIQGGFVMPGDGPGFFADVALKDGRIAAVAANIPPGSAAAVIRAEGRWVCPGFIDLHAHSAMQSFDNPLLAPKIAQGFTTEVIHPDGLAPAPVAPSRVNDRRAYLRPLEGDGPQDWTWTTMGEFFAQLDDTHPTTTLVPSVGHNAVRDYVMGDDNRPPSPAELRAMEDTVRQAIESGARMLSLGLIYLPGVYAHTSELVALANIAAEYHVPLMPHIRNEGEGVITALQEMIGVARASQAPLHISHLKLVGAGHLLEPMLALIDDAAQTLDLSFDQYPYGAGSTLLTALLPPWALEGGAPSIMARLGDETVRAKMRQDTAQGLEGWENLYGACGPENITIADISPAESEVLGQSLRDIAQGRGCDPLEVVFDLLHSTQLNVAMIDHYATEEVVRAIFQHPRALVGTDGIFGGKPHPRLYGTAARVLGRYALREGLISPDEAVARLTARAADRLNLTDRGRIRPGLRGDLVILDPETFLDRATFDRPQQYPAGIQAVLVAGQTVWHEGGPTGQRPGGVLWNH